LHIFIHQKQLKIVHNYKYKNYQGVAKIIHRVLSPYIRVKSLSSAAPEKIFIFLAMINYHEQIIKINAKINPKK